MPELCVSSMTGMRCVHGFTFRYSDIQILIYKRSLIFRYSDIQILIYKRSLIFRYSDIQTFAYKRSLIFKITYINDHLYSDIQDYECTPPRKS